MREDVTALIDAHHAALALRSYTSRLANILRSEPDREAAAIGRWTLSDVANHITWGIENYARWVQGQDAPDLDEIRDMARWNMETVRGLPPAHLGQLADRIETATDEFLRATRQKPARVMAYGLGYIGPYFVHEEKLNFEGTIRMRIRGGADLFYVVENRRLHVAREGPRPGWHLSVDPVAWVLVATERVNQWAAAIRGHIVGWGTRPGLPFKLRGATFQG